MTRRAAEPSPGATVAEVLAQTLAEVGVTTVFGLPGGENTAVLDALRRVGLEFVLVRNEGSAVFMADVTARLTGAPGVCLTTLGPGIANAFCGVAHAHLDRAPVLVLSAESPAGVVGRHTHQVLDLEAIFRPVTKRTSSLSRSGTRRAVLKALRLARRPRPGPVHLRVSSEVAVLSTLPDDSPPVRESAGVSFGGDLVAAATSLTRSRRPLLVVGLGLEPERPYGALRALAEAIGAPVVSTPKAKGSLPDDHPLAAGVLGLTWTDPAYQLLDESDLIIAVGLDVVELVRPWDQPQPLIWLATWPNEDPRIAAEAELVGAVGSALERLRQVAVAPAPGWGASRVAVFRSGLGAEPLPEPAVGRMRPQEVLRALRRELPRDAFVASDVGSHKILASLSWPALVPNRFHLSNGLSAMGFALPAAIAAARVLGRPTLCLTGDGGLAMMLGEAGLLTESRLPVLIVMMNDGALDLIRSSQRRAGRPVFGTEFANPSYLEVMRGYGLEAYRVESEEACAAAVRAALVAGAPAFIEAMVDPVSYPTTP